MHGNGVGSGVAVVAGGARAQPGGLSRFSKGKGRGGQACIIHPSINHSTQSHSSITQSAPSIKLISLLAKE